MFQLDEGHSYQCTLDEILRTAREIMPDIDPVLLEKALRYAFENFKKLDYVWNGPKQAMHELCRGCEIIIHSKTAAEVQSGFFYRYFSKPLHWYARINSALPLLVMSGVMHLTRYQPTIFTLITGISDNAHYDADKDFIGNASYTVVVIVQASLVSLFTGLPLACLYALSVVITGILSLRMRSTGQLAWMKTGWAERLREQELPQLLRFYSERESASK